jgi:hypothetical protein
VRQDTVTGELVGLLPLTLFRLPLLAALDRSRDLLVVFRHLREAVRPQALRSGPVPFRRFLAALLGLVLLRHLYPSLRVWREAGRAGCPLRGLPEPAPTWNGIMSPERSALPWLVLVASARPAGSTNWGRERLPLMPSLMSFCDKKTAGAMTLLGRASCY